MSALIHTARPEAAELSGPRRPANGFLDGGGVIVSIANFEGVRGSLGVTRLERQPECPLIHGGVVPQKCQTPQPWGAVAG